MQITSEPPGFVYLQYHNQCPNPAIVKPRALFQLKTTVLYVERPKPTNSNPMTKPANWNRKPGHKARCVREVVQGFKQLSPHSKNLVSKENDGLKPALFRSWVPSTRLRQPGRQEGIRFSHVLPEVHVFVHPSILRGVSPCPCADIVGIALLPAKQRLQMQAVLRRLSGLCVSGEEATEMSGAA